MAQFVLRCGKVPAHKLRRMSCAAVKRLTAALKRLYHHFGSGDPQVSTTGEELEILPRLFTALLLLGDASLLVGCPVALGSVSSIAARGQPAMHGGFERFCCVQLSGWVSAQARCPRRGMGWATLHSAIVFISDSCAAAGRLSRQGLCVDRLVP